MLTVNAMMEIRKAAEPLFRNGWRLDADPKSDVLSFTDGEYVMRAVSPVGSSPDIIIRSNGNPVWESVSTLNDRYGWSTGNRFESDAAKLVRLMEVTVDHYDSIVNRLNIGRKEMSMSF